MGLPPHSTNPTEPSWRVFNEPSHYFLLFLLSCALQFRIRKPEVAISLWITVTLKSGQSVFCKATKTDSVKRYLMLKWSALVLSDYIFQALYHAWQVSIDSTQEIPLTYLLSPCLPACHLYCDTASRTKRITCIWACFSDLTFQEINWDANV